MKNRNSAFTFVEIMIVVVIIGLLASMAIPAFIKVKTTRIEQAIKNGQKISQNDKEFYLRHGGKRILSTTEKEESKDSAVSYGFGPRYNIQTIEIDNKTYFLLEKQKVSETVINGKIYWLVPTSKE